MVNENSERDKELRNWELLMGGIILAFLAQGLYDILRDSLPNLSAPWSGIRDGIVLFLVLGVLFLVRRQGRRVIRVNIKKNVAPS